MRRATAALATALAHAGPQVIAEALAAPSNTGAIARLLGEAAALENADRTEPLADALARGAEARAALVAEAGGLLAAPEVARLLGISRQAVEKRRRAGGLLAMRVGSDWRYPAAQFGPDGEPPAGFAVALAGILPDAGPWATLDWLLARDSALDGLSPLAALRAGGAAAATVRRILDARAADGFG